MLTSDAAAIAENNKEDEKNSMTPHRGLIARVFHADCVDVVHGGVAEVFLLTVRVDKRA